MSEARIHTTCILCIKIRRCTPFGVDYLQNVQLISPSKAQIGAFRVNLMYEVHLILQDE